MTAAPRVEGVREALKALKEIDPKLRTATNKRVRKSVVPLQNAVRARIPGVALSNWNSGRYGFEGGAAASGVKVKIGGSKSAKKMTWELVTLRQSNAGGSVFDMAGRKSSGGSPQGRAFISNLNSRFGAASRSMWPAAEAELPRVQANVLEAVNDVAKLTNRELKQQ